MTAVALDIASRLDLLEMYRRYTDPYDRGLAEEVTALFTEKGEFVRAGPAAVRGRRAITDMVRTAAESGAQRQHVVTSVLVEPPVADGTAHGTADVTMVSLRGDALRLVALG